MHGNTPPGSFFSSHTHKVWLVLLALSTLVLLAACGGSTSSGSGATPTAATGNTPTATTASNGHAVTITTDSSGSFAFSPATHHQGGHNCHLDQYDPGGPYRHQ